MTDIVLNGIDGATGHYLVAPMDLDAGVAFARAGNNDDPRGAIGDKHLAGLDFALPFDMDPMTLASAGWAIVCAAGTSSEVRAALDPLVQHRAKSVPAARFKQLDLPAAPIVGDWLKGLGVSAGNVAPTRLPYYVLLVGGPDVIPFEFQYLLALDYAVGRVSFDDVASYAAYAASVVAYETDAAVATTKDVVFWGTHHAGDAPTTLSATNLVTPLFAAKDATGADLPDPTAASVTGFRPRCLLATDATKAALLGVLSGKSSRPALVFTASHGIGFTSGDARQPTDQGALLCQDWTGFGSVGPAQYLTASDVGDDAQLHGVIAFFFACFGAGTPSVDQFILTPGVTPPPLAPKPFVAALPRRLLAHPNKGALAVVGHVDRAWGFSIEPPALGPQILPFRNYLGNLMSGAPVGHAIKGFSDRYEALSTALASSFAPGAAPVAPAQLVPRWVERNDAQNYVVLGDPAVRLRVADMT